MINLADVLRMIAAKSDSPEIIKKFRAAPGVKPARRRPSFQNKSNRSDYQRDYKRQRQEEGGGYKKVPDKVKQWRRDQHKTLEKE